MTLQEARVFTRTHTGTAAPGDIVAVALTPSENPGRPGSASLHVSFDGITFKTVLYSEVEYRVDDYFWGFVVHPELGVPKIDIRYNHESNQLRLGTDAVFEFNTTTPVKIVFKPILDQLVLVRSANGMYFVTAFNRHTGKQIAFFDGQPLTELPSAGIGMRGQGTVVYREYAEGYSYRVTGDPLNVPAQVVTFDDLPATRLDPEDYNLTFTDDLSSVTVRPKAAPGCGHEK